MIQITINDILNNINIFRELSEKPLPIKTAFKIARLIRELDKENTTFDNARRKIIERYAEKDENGNVVTFDNGNISINPENVEKCNSEIIELLNTTIEINAEKIDIETLGDIELTPTQMINLEVFIKE